jgi:hypothetical protein
MISVTMTTHYSRLQPCTCQWGLPTSTIAGSLCLGQRHLRCVLTSHMDPSGSAIQAPPHHHIKDTNYLYTHIPSCNSPFSCPCVIIAECCRMMCRYGTHMSPPVPGLSTPLASPSFPPLHLCEGLGVSHEAHGESGIGGGQADLGSGGREGRGCGGAPLTGLLGRLLLQDTLVQLALLHHCSTEKKGEKRSALGGRRGGREIGGSRHRGRRFVRGCG